MPDVYGVQFGDKHSWTDWGIYLSEHTPGMPAPRKAFIDIPFRNGLLDATKAVSNRTFFETRNITYTFLVDYGVYLPDLTAMIVGHVHGKAMKIITDMDPDYYWDAYTCTVSDPSVDEGIASISIECQCYPFKIRNFETTYKASVTGSNVVMKCENSRMEVLPTITASSGVKLDYTNSFGKAKSVNLSAGSNTVDDLVFMEGVNTLTFSKITNDSNVVVSYREGVL